MVSATGRMVGVGYQGHQVEGLIAELQNHHVTAVVDVRLNPVSRRHGFGKTRLASALDQAGVRYLHLRELGNPRDNRAGFADLDGERGLAARRRYAGLLLAPDARAALARVADLAALERVGVLCFEADGEACHRSQVIEAVSHLLADRAQNSDSIAVSAVVG